MAEPDPYSVNLLGMTSSQDILMFKPVPRVDDFHLPFEPSAKGLSNWLGDLTVADSYASCRQIFCAVQKINALQLKADLHIALLEKIYAQLSPFTDRVEESFLDSSFPLSEQEQKNSEILVWLYSEIARGFFQSVDHIEGWNKKKNAALVLYRSLHASGKALLHICEVYNKPYPGFWLFCYQVFAKAEQLKILDREITVEDSQERTVQEAFNQILTFELCSSNQFRARNIKRIYEFLSTVAKHAKVVSEFEPKYIKSYCKFNLAVDTPPGRITENKMVEDQADRYITTVIVAKKIYQYLRENPAIQGASNSILQNMFLKVVNTLGMAQQRKNARIKKQQHCTGIIGLENLIALLRKDKKPLAEPVAEQQQSTDKNNPLYFVKDFDPRIAGQWEAPELDLVPVGEEDAHQMRETYKRKIRHNRKLDKIFSVYQETSDKKRIWDYPEKKTERQQIPEQEELLHNFEILDSSIHGRKISCLSNNAKVKTGDVIGIAADVVGRIELGLICRVDNAYNENISVGVKLLSLQTTLALLRFPGRKEPTAWALFLPATKSIHPVDSIVFNTTKFKSGEIVSIHLDGKDVRCRLGKTLNSTAAINHLELAYLRDEQ